MPDDVVPPLEPIEGSSNIHSAGHSGRSLYMRFHRRNGTALYRFDGVAPSEYRDLLKAESPGKFFHSKIRSRFIGVKIG